MPSTPARRRPPTSRHRAHSPADAAPAAEPWSSADAPTVRAPAPVAAAAASDAPAALSSLLLPSGPAPSTMAVESAVAGRPRPGEGVPLRTRSRACVCTCVHYVRCQIQTTVDVQYIACITLARASQSPSVFFVSASVAALMAALRILIEHGCTCR